MRLKKRSPRGRECIAPPNLYDAEHRLLAFVDDDGMLNVERRPMTRDEALDLWGYIAENYLPSYLLSV